MSTTSTDSLAEFLRTRRAGADPDALGVTTYGVRRVPGLRREELAELAGVSLTYYTRLEQGSAANPSGQVLDAIARALRLSEVEWSHLYRIANVAPRTPLSHNGISPGLQTLIERMPDVAVIALSPIQDIVAWNRLGHAVLAGQLPFDAPAGELPPNKVELLFTDEPSRILHREYEFEAELAVASLHFVSAGTDDEGLRDLVGRLSVASPHFARLWAQRPVQICAGGTKKFHHPVVGDLDLQYEMLHTPQEDGHRLLMMHALPGSDDDATLRLLASQTISH